MNTQRGLQSIIATVISVSLILLTMLVSIAVPHVRAVSINLPKYLPTQHIISPDDIIASAKTWVTDQVPYNGRAWYQGYRQDCSGYVSMAWQLSNSLSTYTLPSVSHSISKDDLQPGDILLNQWGGWTKYGSPNAHVVIFDSWVDSSHTHYNAFEESPYYGKANYTANIPYPYWPGYDTSDYVPMRLNNLSNSPQQTQQKSVPPTPISPTPPTPVLPPTPVPPTVIPPTTIPPTAIPPTPVPPTPVPPTPIPITSPVPSGFSGIVDPFNGSGQANGSMTISSSVDDGNGGYNISGTIVIGAPVSVNASYTGNIDSSGNMTFTFSSGGSTWKFDTGTNMEKDINGQYTNPTGNYSVDGNPAGSWDF